jgi:acyl-CoA thioesterase
VADLTEALELHRTCEGKWSVHADPRYEAVAGMFGGWTTAVVLRAVVDDARSFGMPAACTVDFAAPVPAGADATITTVLVRQGRSVQHWRADLCDGSDGSVLAHAVVIQSVRQARDGFTEPAMPEAPDPETLPEFHPPGTAGAHISVRTIFPNVPFGQDSTRSSHWVKEMSGRPVDWLQLAFLCDSYAPRIFFHSPGPRPSLTLTMSVYFTGSAQEIADVGDDYLLNEAIGTRANEGIVGQQARLWNRHGALLATTEQLCWYQ